MSAKDHKAYLEAIEKSLDGVRPYLKTDGGDVELIGLSEDMVVSIKLLGNCKSCQMSGMTMKNGIEESIRKAVPEVQAVVEVA